MSRMIRISDGCYVAADLIAEIKMNSSSSTITVRMKDGIGHCHSPGYKQTVYAALDALIAEVNSALSTASSAGGVSDDKGLK